MNLDDFSNQKKKKSKKSKDSKKKKKFLTPEQYEQKIEDLKCEIKSLKADCSLLLAENYELIDLCEEHLEDFEYERTMQMFTRDFPRE